jgi:predicted nucleotidyltransferase
LKSRTEVAREAARLIYVGEVESYKDGKEQAALNLGVDSMPSNYEVAVELDLFAAKMEGEERRLLLTVMRREALNLMRVSAEFMPVLIGSVWRGTARKGSDVDIVVYSDQSELVYNRLKKAGVNLGEPEETALIKNGHSIRSVHIPVKISEEIEAELVVRPLEEAEKIERCEVFGDQKRGLSIEKLEKLLLTDPDKKFIPRRR